MLIKLSLASIAPFSLVLGYLTPALLTADIHNLLLLKLGGHTPSIFWAALLVPWWQVTVSCRLLVQLARLFCWYYRWFIY